MNTEYCIYRDVMFEEKTRAELDDSRRENQILLNAWNALQIGKCPDIEMLIMRPEQLYNQTIDKSVTVPETTGAFKLSKEAYLQSLSLPDPTTVIELSRRVRQKSYCAVPGLWTVSDDGTTVEWVASVAEKYIDRMSLYASDTEKIKIARDLQRVCDLINSLNKSGVKLTDCRDSHLHGWTRGKFKIMELPGNEMELAVDPDLLKDILKK